MRKKTVQRQSEVLEVLKGNGRPMTAYEILDRLRQSEPTLAPQTIYRTLSALTDSGQAHRLEAANAFVVCCRDHRGPHSAVLLVCNECGEAQERADEETTRRLGRLADKTGFRAQKHVLEIHGLCEACARAD